MNWAEFYTKLYERLSLRKYLPAVLDELEYGPPGGRPTGLVPRADVFRQAADDAADATNRLYGEWRELDTFARYHERQINPWSAA